MLNALGQQPGGQARTADLPPTPFLRTPPNAPQPIQFDSPMEAIAGLGQGLQQLKAGQLTQPEFTVLLRAVLRLLTTVASSR